MKKLNNSASPFIMLLVPVFLMIGILATHVNTEIPAQKQKASIKLQVPSLKNLIQVGFK